MEEKRFFVDEPDVLYLCMGSACHQHGVYRVLPALQQLLADHGLEGQVRLKGAFCLGPCSQGIVLRYEGELITGVFPDNLTDKFQQEILPRVTRRGRIKEQG